MPRGGEIPVDGLPCHAECLGDLVDALRAERGSARRLPRITRRSSRHCDRPELVHLLRARSGATVRRHILSRTTALVVLEGNADTSEIADPEEVSAALAAMWGTGEWQHVLNPDMPWNEEIRAAWARAERMAASPGAVALMMPLLSEVDVRAVLPTVRVPTLVVHHTDDAMLVPATGKYIADHIPGAKYVQLPDRNMYHFVEPWRSSFHEVAQFLTGHQADVSDDQVLATVLFTDIVDSTRRAAEIGDRDWHALLDAHDAVVRSQLARFRGREVNIGRRVPRGVRRPTACNALRHGNPRRGAGTRHRSARRIAHRRVRGSRR